jgi:NAD(P)-dependent dehydrogenase (short-subunit alcohol dehydrogenase family)
MMMSRFSGAVAVVTGAGNGIGAATAATLARQGARVVVADLDAEAGTSVVKKIEDDGGEAMNVALDVSDEAGWARAVPEVEDRWGPVSLLFGNAALTSPARLGYGIDLEYLPADLWENVLHVNVGGNLLACKYLIPSMRRAGGVASIVFTSSILALRGKADGVAYGVSKAALLSLTRSVAAEYGRYGIRCNAITPGLVLTRVLAAASPERISALERLIPLGRLAAAEELADVTAFLLSSESSYITGQTLTVDGGMTIRYPSPDA